MKKTKDLTEKEALLELERICRIICYQSVEDSEIDFFRKGLKTSLETIAEIRKREEEKKEERRLKRELEKATRYLSGRKKNERR